MAGFNWVDIFLIIMLLFGMVVGYRQGLIRELLGLAAIYVSLVIATQFFVPLSLVVSQVTLNPPNTLTNAISFFFILFVGIFVLNLLGQDAYRQLRFKLPSIIDNVTGMFLGVASMWIVISVVVNVLTFAINTQAWGNAEGYRLILSKGITESLISEVTGSTLPMIVATIRLWMPGGMPALFDL